MVAHACPRLVREPRIAALAPRRVGPALRPQRSAAPGLRRSRSRIDLCAHDVYDAVEHATFHRMYKACRPPGAVSGANCSLDDSRTRPAHRLERTLVFRKWVPRVDTRVPFARNANRCAVML